MRPGWPTITKADRHASLTVSRAACFPAARRLPSASCPPHCRRNGGSNCCRNSDREVRRSRGPGKISEEDVYRWFSAGAGTLAAVLVIGGVTVLALRRLLVPRVRATTSPVDYVALILLLIVIITGIVPTIGVNLFGHGYDYHRNTVAPWFRGLFAFSPAVSAIDNAPIIYQVHASAAWLIWAV
jgi:hypothetical protein